MKVNWIEMRDGTLLYSTIHEPADTPKAHVHLIHGLAEHSGRYSQFIDYLQAYGYLITVHDQRGHGRTAIENKQRYGYLGDHVSFDHLVDDVFEVIQFYQHAHPELSTTLIGHSMGSFVGRRFIQLYGNSVNQVVLSGTGSNPKLMGYIGGVLAQFREKRLPAQQPDELLNQMVFGKFSKQFSDDNSSFAWLSREQESVKAYVEDEACGFVPTAQMFRVLLEGMDKIETPEWLRNIPNELPILLLSGTDDPVGGRAKGVWKVAKQLVKAEQQHVTVQLYEEGRHEMLQEINRFEVFNNIVGWMNQHE
ncbi:alpha/beta fold hydrolase [Sporosarcina obsidiansis]|uniref:alpha/beta fold hydrolase n=1 Tax=Sporosarcina obsidiansis TaxID=2660748 RepID=UPI00129B56A3|nr:alpha/beta fold hydrolase [Sporosarcina obsidiansis]